MHLDLDGQGVLPEIGKHLLPVVERVQRVARWKLTEGRRGRCSRDSHHRVTQIQRHGTDAHESHRFDAVAGGDPADRVVDHSRLDEQALPVGRDEHAATQAAPGRGHADDLHAVTGAGQPRQPPQRHRLRRERVSRGRPDDPHVLRCENPEEGPQQVPPRADLAGAKPNDLHLGVDQSRDGRFRERRQAPGLDRAAFDIDPQDRAQRDVVPHRADDPRQRDQIVIAASRKKLGQADTSGLRPRSGGQGFDRRVPHAVAEQALEDQAAHAHAVARCRFERERTVFAMDKGNPGRVADHERAVRVAADDDRLQRHRRVRPGPEAGVGHGAGRRERCCRVAGGGPFSRQDRHGHDHTARKAPGNGCHETPLRNTPRSGGITTELVRPCCGSIPR